MKTSKVTTACGRLSLFLSPWVIVKKLPVKGDRMDQSTPTTFKWLIISSVAYIIISLIAAAVAIQANLPAQPMGEGSGSGKPVIEDFLFGGGTAMSPGLPWLITQAILTVLAYKKNWWGTFGIAGLVIFGLLSGIFSLTEPNVQKIFSPAAFDAIKAVLQAGVIVLPFVMMVFGILEWRRRRQG
jgi:magnesium-transporting ATPase (P-type)